MRAVRLAVGKAALIGMIVAVTFYANNCSCAEIETPFARPLSARIIFIQIGYTESKFSLTYDLHGNFITNDHRHAAPKWRSRLDVNGCDGVIEFGVANMNSVIGGYSYCRGNFCYCADRPPFIIDNEHYSITISNIAIGGQKEPSSQHVGGVRRKEVFFHNTQLDIEHQNLSKQENGGQASENNESERILTDLIRC